MLRHPQKSLIYKRSGSLLNLDFVSVNYTLIIFSGVSGQCDFVGESNQIVNKYNTSLVSDWFWSGGKFQSARGYSKLKQAGI